MEVYLHPAMIGDEMENFIDYILDGEWSEEKQMMAVAFEEAFVNVCNYAYPEKNGYIKVLIQKHEDYIQADIWDEGMPYDPTTVPLKEIEELQIGGHGLRLMREYCTLRYERVEGTNHLTLTKYLKKE